MSTLPDPSTQPLETERIIIRTNDGYYVHTNPDDQGRVVALTKEKREATVFVKETFEGGIVAFKDEARGMYVRAYAGGNSFLLADATVRQAHELYYEVAAEFGPGFKTLAGWYWTAINGGGSSVDTTVQHALSHESFHLEQPTNGGGATQGIVGRLRKQGRGLVDDRGWVQPGFCHHGTGIADLLYAPQDEEHNRPLIASAGFHGVRLWTRLRGTDPWSTNPMGWAGREFGHETMGHGAYRDLLIESFKRHQASGQKVILSAGDIVGINSEREIRTYIDLLAEALGTVSPDGSLCAIFESGNELPGIWPDGSPERARDWILKPFKQYFPEVLCTNSQGANESREERFKWCLDPADLDDIHSFRDNQWYDWIRHVINNAYVHEWGTQPRELIWGSEPFGTGRQVSVQPNIHQYDRDVAAISNIAHWLTGQIPCYFCSPGIRYDSAKIQYGETFESMPGFLTVMADSSSLLPADVMSWPRENIVHGGKPDPPGSPNPVFEEPGDGEIDRCYHSFSEDQQHFGGLIFGGESLNSRTYRAYTSEVDKSFGNKARLVVGRV